MTTITDPREEIRARRRRAGRRNAFRTVAAVLVVLAALAAVLGLRGLRRHAGEPGLTVIAVEPTGHSLGDVATAVDAQMARASERRDTVLLVGILDGHDGTVFKGDLFCAPDTNRLRCDDQLAETRSRADDALGKIERLGRPARVDALSALRVTAAHLRTDPVEGPVTLFLNTTGRHDDPLVDLTSPGLPARLDEVVAAAIEAQRIPDGCRDWTVHVVAPTSGDPAQDGAREEFWSRVLDSCGGSLGSMSQRWLADAAELSLPDVSVASEGDRTTYTMESVLFGPGSAKVGERARESVQAIAGHLMATGAHLGPVSVHGYADSTGSDARNDELSRLRAEHVRDLLAELLGLPPARIAAHGHGSLADDGSATSRSGNRRVEIRVAAP